MEKRHQNRLSRSSTGTDEVQFNKRVGGDDHLVPGDLKHKTACVIGLGYVGLPLAIALARHMRVIGYRRDAGKAEKINETTPENLFATADPEYIGEADFIILCVPTPVTNR